MEPRRVLPRESLRCAARRLALLPGLPLSQLHEADTGRCVGYPRFSRDAHAVAQYATAAGTALAAELPRADARLELAVLPTGHIPARPAENGRMESRRLSGRRGCALRRLPHAQEHPRRRQARPAVWRRRGAGLVCAAAR